MVSRMKTPACGGVPPQEEECPGAAISKEVTEWRGAVKATLWIVGCAGGAGLLVGGFAFNTAWGHEGRITIMETQRTYTQETLNEIRSDLKEIKSRLKP